MKLEEVKAQILRCKLDDSLFEAFTACLKRVRGNYERCQHCYTFAAELMRIDAHGAIRLIHWGLAQYSETDFDRYRSYYNLGLIQESIGNYACAKESYLFALQNSNNANLSIDLLRTQLHLTEFSYSDDLAQYCQAASMLDSFAKDFPHAELYLLLGQAVLCMHEADNEKLYAIKQQIRRLLDSSKSATPAVLQRHGIENDLHISNITAQFLNRLGI